MTSGYMPESMPEKGEPGFDQILTALRKAVKESPRLIRDAGRGGSQATRFGRTPARGARPTSGRRGT
jgi:hypothetical protein